MKIGVSHNRNEESIEAKTRWFRSLPLTERMEIFCFYTSLALSVNPQIADFKDAQPTTRRIRIISKARS
jgi:hypothetical protein